MIALIDSLEKFTNEITQNQVYWVEPVLSFFNIKASSYEGSQLIAQRAKYIQSLGIKSTANSTMHRGSYTNKEDFEIEEEEAGKGK